MKKILFFYLTIGALVLASCKGTELVNAPSSKTKREFRGAWIQAVNGQFIGMSTQQMQNTLIHQLDELRSDGVNAIIFQVRPECDALYESTLEPWSRFLTGRQGVAPQPYWDPLKWMVDECHKRGMELHAWINPYRAKTKTTKELASKHVAIQHPDWVFAYDGQFILNPARKECRDFICSVVDDIVARYDIDGLHIDDYFYPYPAAGQTIPDDADFQRNNNGFRDKNDWRRDNVNKFVKQLCETIHKRKPWVKFGVSPFGIYRNRRTDPQGSETAGLQNYDELYADVLLWVNKGWLDYCVPQLYWQIGHKTADYATLIRWWDAHAGNRPLYIGEDIERTVKNADVDNPSINQMPAKYRLHNQMQHVNGTVLWYAKAAVDNMGNYGHTLRDAYWKYPALQPLMPFIDDNAPKAPRKLAVVKTHGKNVLFWTAPKGTGWKNEAYQYVVYRFSANEKIDLSKPDRIVAITTNTFYEMPDNGQPATYVVTALDRLSNESKGAVKRVKR